MAIEKPDSQPSDASEAIEHGRRTLGRRAFLAGAAVSAVPIFAISRGFNRARNLVAASPEAATPAASPVATATPVPPTPTPVPTPTATPVPTPDAGMLQIIDNQHPTYDQQPVAGGALRLPLSIPIDPERSPIAFRQDYLTFSSYLDPLVGIDDVSMEPIPWLAESWEWSEENKVVTYKLRNDVSWHDGSKFAAADVVFSLFVYRDDLDSAVRNFFVNLEFAEAIDDLTVKVTLTAPDANWLLNASSQFIVQRKQYTKIWTSSPEGQRSLSGIDWKNEVPVGTGPWVFTRITDDEIEFKANQNYFAGAPHADSLSLSYFPDSAAMLEAWKKAELDVAWPLREAIRWFRSTRNGLRRRRRFGDVRRAQFRQSDAPASHFFRRSSCAPGTQSCSRSRRIRHQRVQYIHLRGASWHDCPAWATDTSVTNPIRDITTAKALLEDAGFEDRDKDGIVEDSNGVPFTVVALARNDSRPELLEVMSGLVTNFQEIGVALDLQVLAADQFRDRWVNGHDFDLIAYAYNLFPGFTDFDLYGSSWNIRINPQGWNPGGYNNPDADVAIRKYLIAPELAEAKKQLSDLQKTTNENLFALWFGFPRDLVLVRPEILGFQPNKLWQTANTRLLWRAQ